MSLRDQCACGHADADHAVYLDRPCTQCRCPGFHDTPRIVKTVINRSWPLYLPSHRAYRPEWTSDHGWEPERLQSMSRHIGYGDVVFDVGAEQGDLPALWGSWGATVVPIEPEPRVWPSIRACFEANDLAPPPTWWVGFASDVTRWPDAYDPGVARDGWPACAFGTIDTQAGFAHLAQQGDTIPQITLDDLAARAGLAPTAITIDVEGSELRVLQGAAMILTQDRPWVWCSLHMDARWMSEFYPDGEERDVINYMGSVGYRAEVLGRDHELHMAFVPEERA